jgi:TonB family protein
MRNSGTLQLLLLLTLLAQFDVPGATAADLPPCPTGEYPHEGPDRARRPKYPRQALKRNIGGVADVKAVVAPNGKTEFRVVSGPEILAKASLDALRRWRFHPAIVNGAPVESTYDVRIVFWLTTQDAVADVRLVSPQQIEPRLPEPSTAFADNPDGPVFRQSDAGILSPKVTYRIEPEFSEAARRKEEQGNVRVLVLVTADGLPGDLRLVCSDSADLNQNALSAVRQWRFQPGTKDGKPVNVEILVEVEFHLTNGIGP